MKEHPIAVFQKEAPQVAEAFDGLIQALAGTGGLDNKTKELIYIGIKSSIGDSLAMEYHVPMAKKLGASRAEVQDAILITVTTSGLRGIVACLPKAMAAYDNASVG